MQFEIGAQVSGFRVTEIRDSRELNGRGVTLIHEKTGARVFWLDNGAENAVFSIAFQTLPENDTGVFHMLEHSVLCGSGKYRVREPFVELLKGSMSTFLNAMTFPDMTLYPVSSRNPKDLMNLAEVYLDAVFDPICAREEKVFRQEGWHIEWDEAGQPIYKGVVFNEMKGAMSETDSLIDQQLMKQMFPDTAYGFNSGGDPEHIPDLTYEDFVRQYQKHYHPSNAWIYLDGDVPMDKMLPLIASYLDRYERKEALPGPAPQRPVASEQTIFYELSQEEELENRGYYTQGRIVGGWTDRTENQARAVICDVLTGSNEAPLKRAILEKGIAEEFSLSMDDTGFQSWMILQAENVQDGREAEIAQAVRAEADRLRREGLDRNAVEATLNRVIYHLREEEEPQGIGRCIRVMAPWMYGGDPLEALETEELVRELRRMLEEGAFDRLALDMLENTEGLAVLHTLPSHTIGAERRAEEAARLERITGAWTKEERDKNERLLETLSAWQSTPDSPEALASLPRLSREDADIPPEWTETEEREIHGVRVLLHRIPCGGVVHLRMYFALTDCTLEELTRVGVLGTLMGKLPTRKHDAWTLQQEIKRYTGHFGVTVTGYARPGQGDTCMPCLMAFASALKENAEKAAEVLAEVLLETRFDEPERMEEIIRQTEIGLRQRVVAAGHVIGVRNALSHFSAEGAVRNALEGDQAIRYIHALVQEPEKEIPALQETLNWVLSRTLCRKRMILSWTGDEEMNLEPIIRAFPEGEAAPAERAYRSKAPRRRGYRIPAQIGFAVQGWRLSEMGESFRGSQWLAANILSLDYLWNRVRVQGGAYGAGLSIDRSGNVYTYSFRDPTPGRSLNINEGLAEALEVFADGDAAEMEKYIISSLNELNPLTSPREKGSVADSRLLTGYTREDAERVRREVLYATAEDLRACASWLRRMAQEGAVCVVAHQDALDACGDLEEAEL